MVDQTWVTQTKCYHFIAIELIFNGRNSKCVFHFSLSQLNSGEQSLDVVWTQEEKHTYTYTHMRLQLPEVDLSYERVFTVWKYVLWMYVSFVVKIFGNGAARTKTVHNR